MQAHQHFALKMPAFEGHPDPRFFYRSPSHVEALATLQYAVHAGKPALAIVGDAGSGKTLLGRLAVQTLGRRTGVVWVHGMGQSDTGTEALVCPADNLAPENRTIRGNLQIADLAEWSRGRLGSRLENLLVIDNADGLPARGWETLLGILTREMRLRRPLTVVLLGIPTLLNTLADPALARIQRRIFRVCHLRRLNREQVADYVRYRIRVAGGIPRSEFFTNDALDLVYRLSGGMPAMINQICDNAMIDAFGDNRLRIEAHDIMAAARAISGVDSASGMLTGGATVPAARQLTDPRTNEYRSLARLKRLAELPQQVITSSVKTVPVEGALPEAGPLGHRLRALELGLSDALSRVREARQQRTLDASPAESQPAE